MAAELAHAWADLVAALEELAPVSAATIRPPVPRAVERLEAAVQADLTDELREWFTLHGGTPPRGFANVGLGARLFPEGYLTSVDEAIGYDARWRQFRSELGAGPGSFVGEAGEAVGGWAPQYVLVACDQGDGWMFVDTRPGSKRGCVGQYVKGNSDFADGTEYPSLTALVGAVTRSIRYGETVGDYWYATTPDGELVWDLVDPPPTPPASDRRGWKDDAGDHLAPETDPPADGGRGPMRSLALLTDIEGADHPRPDERRSR